MKQNLIALIQGKVKYSTKILFGVLLGFGALMQIDAVKNYITPILAAHPKASSIVGSLVGISMLLHNPQVQSILGIKTGE